MSRSGYNDDFCDNEWELVLWRGAVARATRGKRGQKLLTELLAALDAMPEKRLITGDLERDGEVCALGAVARAKGIPDLADMDPEDYNLIAASLNVAPALAREALYMNDEGMSGIETPEGRWRRMRRWVTEQIVVEK